MANVDSLVAQAAGHFGNLTKYETQVLRESAGDDCTVCKLYLLPAESPENPAKADKLWGPERNVRAALIRWLCLDPEASKNIAPRGLQVRGAKITSDLNLSGMSIGFPLTFIQCRLATIDLRYAKISSLNLGGCAIDSLNADGAEIEAMVDLNLGFVSSGEVRMVGARVGGTVNCVAASFEQTDIEISEDHPAFTCAFHADRLEVRGNLQIRDSFVAVGMVRLLGARIDGTLECNDGTFARLDLEGATVQDGFFWQKVRECKGINVAGMSTRALTDDEASWSRAREVILDGFTYERIINGPVDVQMRLNWLASQEKFASQPYRQAAKVLEEMGYHDSAKEILLEMTSRIRAQDRASDGSAVKVVDYLWDGLLNSTVGYGIYPLRATWYLGGLVGVGFLVHWRARRMSAMAPTDRDAYNDFRNGELPPDYPPFSAFVYSLENCVPIIKLGQDDDWQPDPSPDMEIAPRRMLTPRVLRVVRRIMVCLGWLLTTLLVAGLTGLLKAS
jgi:hypothetical protein